MSLPENNEMFSVCSYGKTDWLDGFGDFGSWLSAEQRKAVPRGPCGQSMLITSGHLGLLGKYPSFMDAYAAYQKEVAETGAIAES